MSSTNDSTKVHGSSASASSLPDGTEAQGAADGSWTHEVEIMENGNPFCVISDSNGHHIAYLTLDPERVIDRARLAAAAPDLLAALEDAVPDLEFAVAMIGQYHPERAEKISEKLVAKRTAIAKARAE